MPRTHLLWVVCFSACGAAPPMQDQAAASLLEQHLVWSGGAAAFAALDDLVLEGTLSVSGMEGKLSVVMTRAGLTRQSYDLGVVQGAEGVDAQGGWRRNQSGQLEVLGSDDVERLRGEIRRAFGEHLRPQARTRATFAGKEQRDGITCDVVRFAEDSGAVDMLLAGGALAAIRQTRRGDTREVTFSDYRVVAGVKIAHRVVTSGDNPQVVQWTSIRANSKSDAAALARPSATRAVGTLAAGTSIDLALDLHLECYAYVAGALNGEPTDIVLDSGAGITVVDQALADKVGLQGAGDVRAKGVGGEARSVKLAPATVRLGGLELKDIRVAILDLSEVHERVGRRMPVILGKELFHAFTVTFDYPQRRLRVCQPDACVVPATAVACPARFLDDGHAMIQLEFEDLGPGWFMVDTGAGDTLALHAPYVDKHAVLARYARVGDRLIGGVGGSLPAKTATAARVQLAGQTFRHVPVTLATEHKGAFGSAKCDGNLGAELLRRFVVTFDYHNQRLLFVPGAELDAPFAKDRSGLILDRRDGKVVVALVAANSPAAAAGFHGGEVLVAVDGETLQGHDRIDVLRRALRQPVGTELRVRDAAGVERAITLADYF